MSESGRRIAMVFAILSVAACAGGDARTELVVPGMSRDSALLVLRSEVDGAPPPVIGDPNANVWRVAPYLHSGKMIEVIYYSADNEHRTPTDTVPDKRVVPIVIIDGIVAGVGKAAYDKAAKEFALPKVRY